MEFADDGTFVVGNIKGAVDDGLLSYMLDRLTGWTCFISTAMLIAFYSII